MQLHQIREARAARVQEARSLLASMPTLTPEAQTKFDAIKAEIVNLEGQEARAQFIEDAERRSLGQPVDKARNELEGHVNVLDAIAAQIETRLSMALARAVAVHPTATAGRAADQVNQNTAERSARQDDGDDLIPRLRAV
jgi:hypothetical protein